jgi:hypothetical protein
MPRQREMLATAIGALCMGVLLYALDRQHDHVYFLSAWTPAYYPAVRVFGTLGNYLPTFIHVYAFILLTVAVAAPSINKIIPICLAWFTLDTLFEIAQIDSGARWIAHHIPAWFSGIPFLENTANYFLFGTFDVLDLLSIAAGTSAAYFTIRISPGRKLGHEREK